MTAYTEKMKTGPQFLRAKLVLAQIAVQQKEYDKALALVDEVLAENSSDLGAQILKGDLLLQSRDFDGAIAEYRAVLRDVPLSVPVMFSLAKAHIGNDENSLALDLLQQAFDLDSKVVPMATLLAQIYQQEGKFAQALSVTEKALQENPENPGLFEMTVSLMVRRGRAADALELCRQYLAKKPDDPQLNVLLARIHIAMRDFPPARERLIKVLSQDPDNRAALFILVQLEMFKGSPQEALTHARQLRQKEPENQVYALVLANLYEQTGSFAEAAEIYGEILVQNPQSLVAANNLAYYYVEHQASVENIAKAKELLKPYIDKYREDPVLMDTAAWACFHAGEYEKALELLGGLEEKIKQSPEALYHLGMINKKLGNREKAKSCLQAALMNKKFIAVKKAEAALQEL